MFAQASRTVTYVQCFDWNIKWHTWFLFFFFLFFFFFFFLKSRGEIYHHHYYKQNLLKTHPSPKNELGFFSNFFQKGAKPFSLRLLLRYQLAQYGNRHLLVKRICLYLKNLDISHFCLCLFSLHTNKVFCQGFI